MHFSTVFLSCAIIFCAVVSAHSSIDLAQDDPNLPRLERGRLIEKPLKASEQHTYQVSVEADQFLHLIVQQHGIDVAVTVFSSDNKKIIEVDNPNGRDGPENVLVVLGSAGIYRVQIRSIEAEAPAGRYTLTLETQRPATQQDRDRIVDHATLDQVLARAQESIAEDTGDSLRAAIEKFHEALSLSQKTGDRTIEGFIHFRLGFVHDRLGDKRQALDHCFLALPILRETGDLRNEAAVLSNIGLTYSSIGEPHKSLEFHEKALNLKRALGDRLEEGITLNNLGLTYISIGEI